MGDRWIQLKSIKNIERSGRMRQYHPGDWVAVGKQTALRWIAEGSAYDPKMTIKSYVGDDYGIRILHNPSVGNKILSSDERGDIPFMTEGPILPWESTLVWNPGAVLRKELIAVGFGFLDVWQMAIPLIDYETMALNTGNKDDQDKTRELVGDLRIPMYDPSLIFVHKCAETIEIFRLWEQEDDSLQNEHALLRAIFKVKPLVLPLPPNWTNPNYRSSADDW